MKSPTFDVSGAVAVLNQALEYSFPTMTVLGELANFKVAKGRWVYGDVKDDHAKLRLFGTVYNLPGPLEDGMMIEITARPQLHPQFGFSLNIVNIRPVGEGSIKKAADLLRLKLEKEGLFETARKRPVPTAPEKVGLITSVESAAYADFTKILNVRWGGVELLVYNSQVQGEAAIEELLAGLRYFNETADVDVIVLVRGGGSADDLAAFSDERIVRAVAASRAPTCIAIGHEIDVSLAELAADMHASTPSNAAELLFPDKSDVLERLQLQKSRLSDQVSSFIDTKLSDLALTRSDLVDAVDRALEEKQQRIDQARKLLESFHPRSTLKRGYALVQTKQKKLVTSHSQLSVGDTLSLTFTDGRAETEVQKT